MEFSNKSMSVDFDKLNELSHSTSMLDVLDHYGIEYISSSSDKFKVVCPFHNDHDPSMVIYTHDGNKDESYYCYVCNEGGDSFHFIRQMEEGNFSKSWLTICEINKIEGYQVNKKPILNSPREVKRSNSKITMQIADLYRALLKQNKQLLPSIDQRYQELDKFLSTNPSYVELHQYFKRELIHYNLLQKTTR